MESKSNSQQLTRSQLHPLYPALYPRTHFYSQTRPNTAKAEMNKTIVDIERISDCTSKPNIAKIAFEN
jgi:hypothetical protein